jgi:glycerol-3-phosphate dehydrogenase
LNLKLNTKTNFNIKGMISVMGGKWTVYRIMGEEAIDAIVRILKGNLNDKYIHFWPSKN